MNRAILNWVTCGIIAAVLTGIGSEAAAQPLLEADASLLRRDDRTGRAIYRVSRLRSLVVAGRTRETASVRLGCRSSDVLAWETTIAVGDTLGFAWVDKDGVRGLKLPARGWPRSCRCTGKRDRMLTNLQGSFPTEDGEVERLRRVGGAPGILRILSFGLLKGPRPPKHITVRLGWDLEPTENATIVRGAGR